MNYIKQLNGFHIRIDLEPISVHARSLWNTLMDINNRLGWCAEFSVAELKLSSKAGLSDSNFKSACKELEENGYIQVTSGTDNRTSVYKIICLYENVGNESHHLDQEMERNVNHKLTHKMDDKVDPLIKKKLKKKLKKKQNNKTTTTDAYGFLTGSFFCNDAMLCE
ncbi:hypothetical protein [Virgibacillus necropolis]|uniref:Helix-turn-helix domain-containing protein n=1 Tax=Virgibacillus necropolis TaxID=163877 RepID=A0A221M886_9BACI|nr:hypothetical protein [Virgibacillus necropolis]ASN03854.1 hypothetical protein CFK40_01975 [Virgibacillus necropolis]